MQDGTTTWAEIAERLSPPRQYWLSTTTPSAAPHAAPVWGVVIEETLYFYSQRNTVRAVVHLESGEDVLIVRGRLDDLGTPAEVPCVVAALAAKYTRPEDQQYLPSNDPDCYHARRAIPGRLG